MPSPQQVRQRGLGVGGRRYQRLGERLRARREQRGISLRELARRIDVSPSLVSQIETGKVQPSVSTLYGLINELGGSLDEVLFGEERVSRRTNRTADVGPTDLPADVPAELAPAVLAHPPGPPVQRAGDRKTIKLSWGVRWERLTKQSVPGAEFLYVVYQPGATSGPANEFQRHSGREWCYVVSGTLHIHVGFDEHVLAAGDAITYNSTTPHRLTNPGEEPAEAICFQLG